MTSLPNPASQVKPKLGETNGDREYLMQSAQGRDGSSKVNFKPTGHDRRRTQTACRERRRCAPLGSGRANHRPVAVRPDDEGVIMSWAPTNDEFNARIADYNRANGAHKATTHRRPSFCTYRP